MQLENDKQLKLLKNISEKIQTKQVTHYVDLFEVYLHEMQAVKEENRNLYNILLRSAMIFYNYLYLLDLAEQAKSTVKIQ